MRVQRPGRRRSRGQSLVIVALGGVALIGMTGLALDGGYEVDVYRNAQNGADSGALAAARAIYENQANSTYLNALDSNQGLCGTTSPYGVAPKQVLENNRTAVPGCIAKTLTTYKPAGPDGFQSYGALATVDADVGVSGLATLDSHIGVNEATAAVTDQTTPAASGSVDIAGLSASLTAISNSLLSASGSADLYGCSSSASGAGSSDIVPAAGGSCPGNSLALSLALRILLVSLNVNVDTQLGLSGNIDTSPGSISLVKQALASIVPTTGIPQQRDSTNIAGASLGVLGAVTINANAGTTTTLTGNLGGDETGSQTSVNLANVGTTVAGTAINLSAVDAKAKVSYDPVNGFQATTSCSLLSGEGSGTITIAGVALALNSDCSFTAVNIPGVLSVGSTKSVNCQTGTYGEVCTASVCVLNISVLQALSGVASLDVCLGKATASADFTPVTNTGGIIVTSKIPTHTFFLGVVGVHQTNPEAEAAAVPRQVTDVSSAAFADAPYAVSYYATEASGGQSYCNGSYGPLIPGCNYTVWGSGVDYNAYMDSHCSPTGTSCWDGELKSTSNHAVGTDVTAVLNAAGGGPSSVISGSTYILLPVIDDTGQVIQYGLFEPTSDNKVYTLARNPDPVNSVVAPLAQSETDGAWMPNDEGAVSTKLVDPSYFTSTSGWS